MKNRKSLAAGLAAAALVSAIGLAYAQSDDPSLPATPAEAIDRGIQPDQLQTQPAADQLTPQDQTAQSTTDATKTTDATQQSQDSMANSTAQTAQQADSSSASSSKPYSENPAPTYGTSSDTAQRAPRADRN